MDEPTWRDMTAEEKTKYLRARYLVYYRGHFVAEEAWYDDPEGVRREIDAKWHRMWVGGPG